MPSPQIEKFNREATRSVTQHQKTMQGGARFLFAPLGAFVF